MAVGQKIAAVATTAPQAAALPLSCARFFEIWCCGVNRAPVLLIILCSPCLCCRLWRVWEASLTRQGREVRISHG
jgi:hypothetical protein